MKELMMLLSHQAVRREYALMKVASCSLFTTSIGVRMISESLVLAVESFRIFLTFGAENEGEPSKITILSIFTAEN
jgi:hypothetical protein